MFIDIILSPFVLLSSLCLKIVRRAGIKDMQLSKEIFFKIGIYPLVDHYYEPQFNFSTLKKNLNEPRQLSGINWNDAEQLFLLKEFTFSYELKQLKTTFTSPIEYYFGNNSFESGDAEIWYNLIRYIKPRKIIEIGSGHSTNLARLALKYNTSEDPNHACLHICIEPYEMAWLEKLGIEIIRQKVEDVDLSIFLQLEANDILFIDSSHIIRPQGDVITEIFNILPCLKTGVIVHIHDIFSPRDYIQEWLKEDIKFWNEQYLLEAFLMFNPEWKIIGGLNYLKHKYPIELSNACLHLTTDREPGSFYIQKISNSSINL